MQFCENRTMRAALLSHNRITFVSRPAPTPGHGELLLRVAFLGICGSDQARYWGVENEAPAEVVFGHEFSARVHTIGPGVTGYRVGEPVTVAPLLTCGVCRHCQLGSENQCEKRQRFGAAVDGAAQEYVVVPARCVYRLDPDLSLVEGALVEPLAIAEHAVGRVEASENDTALVMGAGAIGLLAAQVLKTKGLARVAVADIDERRLTLARSLGLDTVLSEPSALRAWLSRCKPAEVELIVEASGAQAALDMLPLLLAPSGQVIVVSKFSGATPLRFVDFLRREARLSFSRYFIAKDFERALDHIRRKQVKVRPLAETIVPASQLGVEGGRAVMQLARQNVRVLLDWDADDGEHG